MAIIGALLGVWGFLFALQRASNNKILPLFMGVVAILTLVKMFTTVGSLISGHGHHHEHDAHHDHSHKKEGGHDDKSHH